MHAEKTSESQDDFTAPDGGGDAPAPEVCERVDTADPASESLAFTVAPEEEGARLDAYLAARVEGVSRTALKRLIEEGEVLVSGAARKASYKLRAGERVEAEIAPPAPLELAPENIPLDIVYEDGELVVVNKPAGLVVHPAAGVASGTLANALAYRFGAGGGGRGAGNKPDALAAEAGLTDSNPRPPTPGPRPPRVGIVHRLDRDTSGLLVVAKTPAAHEHLTEQFRAREVFKLYTALAHGVVKEDSGRVEEPVGRDQLNRTRMAVVRRGGRAALSVFRVRRRYQRFTLLDVEIKTGRTHQIRVHLAWLKHPVVGDEVYNAGRDRQLGDPAVRARVASLGRQFLHAARLGFRHPRTGEWLKFEAPVPADLQTLLDFLEEHS